jgi:hypothetical protein
VPHISCPSVRSVSRFLCVIVVFAVGQALWINWMVVTAMVYYISYLRDLRYGYHLHGSFLLAHAAVLLYAIAAFLGFRDAFQDLTTLWRRLGQLSIERTGSVTTDTVRWCGLHVSPDSVGDNVAGVALSHRRGQTDWTSNPHGDLHGDSQT